MTIALIALAAYYVIGVYVGIRSWARFNGRLEHKPDYATWGDVVSTGIIFWMIWPATICFGRAWTKKVAVVFDKTAISFGDKK